jgi:uncharacterized protein YlxP (DUF503 family)
LSFVCLVEIRLHFPENGSLKGKRKELKGLKAQLQRRFGAAVAETEHHDLWQRATLSAAVVSRSANGATESAARIERYVRSCFPDGVSTERALVSGDDLLGG